MSIRAAARLTAIRGRRASSINLMLGVALGLVLGLFGRPVHPLLAMSMLCMAVSGGLVLRICMKGRRPGSLR